MTKESNAEAAKIIVELEVIAQRLVALKQNRALQASVKLWSAIEFLKPLQDSPGKGTAVE